jgi:hypothetical protein
MNNRKNLNIEKETTGEKIKNNTKDTNNLRKEIIKKERKTKRIGRSGHGDTVWRAA